MGQKRKTKKSVNVNQFWMKCILWGIATGAFLGLLAAVFGSSQGKFIGFGLFGFVIGFATGFLLKAVDKFPAREGTFLSKGNYIGGNRMPDADEVIRGLKKK